MKLIIINSQVDVLNVDKSNLKFKFQIVTSSKIYELSAIDNRSRIEWITGYLNNKYINIMIILMNIYISYKKRIAKYWN